MVSRENEMSERRAKARRLHESGMNCAQSVLCAFADEFPEIPEKEFFRISEGFGLGMGDMHGVCGALSGAVMAAGLMNSCGTPDRPVSKRSTYSLAAEFNKKFEEAAGSRICCELKGVGTGKVLCSCADCVDIGTQIAENYLGERKKSHGL